MTWVTAGAMAANGLTYVLYLVAGRLLLPAGYGMFASLVTAQVVLAVPALALQAVIARRIAQRGTGQRGTGQRGTGQRGTAQAGTMPGRALTYRTAAVVTVLAAVATPLLAALLDTPVPAAAAAMAMAPMLVLLAGEQGTLQGHERFPALGVVLGAAGVGKVLPAAVVLLAGAGATAALAAGTAGTAAAVVLARAVVARDGPASNGRPASDAGADGVENASPTVGATASVLRASQVQLVLMLLTSIDLMMARVVLSETDAGVYAMGSVATKAAFWLPAAVGVVLYPRMARPEHSLRAVRVTLAVLAGLGVAVVACAAAAAPLVPVLVGEQYRPVVGLVWLFALVGAAFAVLQGALLSAIARDATRLAVLAWAGLAVEGAALAAASSVTRMAVTAAACALGTTAAVTVAVLLSLRPPEGAARTVSRSGSARWAARAGRRRVGRTGPS
ncbi:polysaccharide biosynthesis protein [Tomitella gaofuii]|uniref:polysaccharide biosynthesis protein n=1 Tax=Tomitella gaofuii TaxID=2760083 RepID=UPI001F24213A|nr:polysaccharide biosynthesis protein [Tomitella gaofuii]